MAGPNEQAAMAHALDVHERELRAHQRAAARQKEAADWHEKHARFEVQLGNLRKARVMQERADLAREREHGARERAAEAERRLTAARRESEPEAK